jgi:tryptophan synthase alpha chain
MDGFLDQVGESGVDGLLVHGLPPRLRSRYYVDAVRAGVSVVTTCYPGSDTGVRLEAARNATAYLYLVAHYGRSGTTPPQGFQRLRPLIAELRASTSAPVAVGFGVRDRADLEALRDLGADAAVVGSAAVARVERAIAERRDVVADLARFVAELRQGGPTTQMRGVSER